MKICEKLFFSPFWFSLSGERRRRGERDRGRKRRGGEGGGEEIFLYIQASFFSCWLSQTFLRGYTLECSPVEHTAYYYEFAHMLTFQLLHTYFSGQMKSQKPSQNEKLILEENQV